MRPASPRVALIGYALAGSALHTPFIETTSLGRPTSTRSSGTSSSTPMTEASWG